MPSDPRQDAIEALVQAMSAAYDDIPYDPTAILDYLDAHPAAKAALVAWLVPNPYTVIETLQDAEHPPTDRLAATPVSSADAGSEAGLNHLPEAGGPTSDSDASARTAAKGMSVGQLKALQAASPADPEPIPNETASGYARRRELVEQARLTNGGIR